MDKVYVRDLKLDARIGIYEWEKRILQKIRVDLEMAWDNRIPAASDDIKDTLNYKTTNGSLSVTVGRALPTVTAWPSAGAIETARVVVKIVKIDLKAGTVTIETPAKNRETIKA